MQSHRNSLMRKELGSSEAALSGRFYCRQSEVNMILLTSAVFGTLSQNISTLMSPRVVCKVTDIIIETADSSQHC